jgi:hypothetical protein
MGRGLSLGACAEGDEGHDEGDVMAPKAMKARM